MTPEDATSSNSGIEQQQPPTNNILPATITKNESLDAIFPFKLEELSNTLLFNRAALEEKLITAMYTDAKIDGHSIKLIFDSVPELLLRIEPPKPPIDEIDDFPIEVNGIIVPIKVLIGTSKSFSLARTVNTHGYQPHVITLSPSLCHQHHLLNSRKKKRNPSEKCTKSYGLTSTTMNCHQYLLETTMTIKRRNKEKNLPEKPPSTLEPTTKEKGKGREKNISEETTTAEEITSDWERKYSREPIKEPPYIPLKCKDWNNMTTQKDKASRTMNYVSLAANNYLTKECEMTFLVEKECVILSISCLNGYPHDKDEIWQMANAKVEGALPNEILKIKNNPSKPTDIVLVFNLDTFINLENSPEEFHEHYQNLAPTKEEQKQCLEKINTQLCDHCLIPCDFQFCDDCDFIYNLPPRMIYTILKEEEPINSCTSESELSSNPNSNSDNNDNKNNDSSFVQNGYNNNTILIMEATQYQALVGNDWLSKANTTLDWNTQELQLTFNRQHARVPAICRHFKTQRTKEPLIEFEDTLLPPTIKTYQDNSWMPEYNGPPADNFFMDDPDAFQNQYQKLQRLANLNTKLCDYCLISCYFQYCDKCNLMFNPPPRILFPITKLSEPKKKEVLITEDMSFQDPTKDTETKQYLTYLNLSKELELKWYSNNKEGICPERAHNTDTNLKIVLEIPVSTMVQVAFQSSLAKKKINVKREIVNASYIENIIVILQNNLDRPYKIKSQEKIAQAIFLSLVKILQLTLITT
ncbi:hypothetical protein G9A89_019378 [Geosiphon pyriformis]|nr:hypothetical protein G9A89_019378 [Geosiphon pyriformis]